MLSPGVVLALILLSGCRGCQDEGSATGRAVPGRVGLDPAGQMRVNEGDRCPVCAMEPSHHARYVSAIELRDGRTFYFCGTGCMLRTWLHPEEHLGVDRTQLARAVTKEYFNGRHVNADDVVFVVGSDIIGPMGPAIVPVQPNEVETFERRHGGRETFRLSELNDERWRMLKRQPSKRPASEGSEE